MLFVFFQPSSRASYEITRLFICFLSSSPVFRSVFSVSPHRRVAGHRHKEGLCPAINAKSARVSEEVSSPAATEAQPCTERQGWLETDGF